MPTLSSQLIKLRRKNEYLETRLKVAEEALESVKTIIQTANTKEYHGCFAPLAKIKRAVDEALKKIRSQDE